jgi:hypothetical protein
LDVPEVFGDVARAAGGVVVAGAQSMGKTANSGVGVVDVNRAVDAFVVVLGSVVLYM